jgi:tetratricopeptide (TPR) repeat protein
VELPNLGEPDKAAVFYEQALRIYQRLVADPNDRQGRFDQASTHGKLGDAVWKKDPKRALDLYGKALAIAQSLVSKEQLDQLRTAYRISIARPLILLGRTSEARKAWSEVSQEAPGPEAPYADRLGDLSIRQILPNLLLAEGEPAEARQALQDLIRDTQAMRSSHPDDLTPLFYLSDCYRALAAITTGQQRREALLRSAAAWHSFPATSFTRREEQKDLAAASR